MPYRCTLSASKPPYVRLRLCEKQTVTASIVSYFAPSRPTSAVPTHTRSGDRRMRDRTVLHCAIQGESGPGEDFGHLHFESLLRALYFHGQRTMPHWAAAILLKNPYGVYQKELSVLRYQHQECNQLPFVTDLPGTPHERCIRLLFEKISVKPTATAPMVPTFCSTCYRIVATLKKQWVTCSSFPSVLILWYRVTWIFLGYKSIYSSTVTAAQSRPDHLNADYHQNPGSNASVPDDHDLVVIE